MGFPVELCVLSLLTCVVVCGAYWQNHRRQSAGGKAEAIGEAGWWGVVFFIYGALDYVLIDFSAR